MDSIWNYARQLKGQTLYTEVRRKPFKVLRVTESNLVIEQGTKGKERPYSRKTIEDGCQAGIKHGVVTMDVLREEKVTEREEGMSYLPVIIRETLKAAGKL